jgi:outer membrane protein
MNIIKCTKVIIITFFFILIFNQSKAETKFAIVEIDKIMKESLVGKSLFQQLDKLDSDNKKDYIEKRKKLFLRKDKINSQKTVLSKDEYEKKVIELNNEFEKFKKEGNKKIINLRTKRDNAMRKLLDELRVILSKYSDENNLAFIIDQKNIIIGKADLNVTSEILKRLNAKIKKIKVN